MPDAYENINMAIATGNIVANNNDSYLTFNDLMPIDNSIDSSIEVFSPYSNSGSRGNMSSGSPMSTSSSPQRITDYINLDDATAIGEPHLTILVQPIEKFRFRYKSEMIGTHGTLIGTSSDPSRRKPVPEVRLNNFSEKAIIRCTLVTSEEDYRIPHAHRLVRRYKSVNRDDPHDIEVSSQNNFTAIFTSMGIIHTARRNIKEELVQKLRAKLLEEHKRENKNATISIREDAQIKSDVEHYQKNINLNSVTLCFQGFIVDQHNVMIPITAPVYSNPIYNLKSALTGELKICRIDKFTSSCEGGEEVFILVEKVGKKNIKIKFFELNDNDQEIWIDYARFSELDVHHQYAIVFRTPPYKDLTITNAREVFLQLERPSDADCSEPIKFIYKPSDRLMGRKRTRISHSNSAELAQMAFNHNVPLSDIQVSASESTEISREIKNILNDRCSSGEFRDFVEHIDLEMYTNLLSNSEHDKLSYDGPSIKKQGDDKSFAKNIVIDAMKYIKMESNEIKRNNIIKNLFIDRSTYGDSPLHYALRNGQNDIAKIIVILISIISISDRKKLVNIQNSSGKTPLHYAVMYYQPKITKVLLMLGADPNLADHCGQMPLHNAVKYEEAGDCVDILLGEKYVNIEAYTDLGWTPLQLATEAGSYHAVKSLVKAGVNVNNTDMSYGRTALHVAVEGGHKDIVEFLLKETNIDVNMKNFSGNTAWHSAYVTPGTKAKEICALLLKYGAHPTISNDESVNNPMLSIKTELNSDDENMEECTRQSSIDLVSNDQEMLQLISNNSVFEEVNTIKQEEDISDMQKVWMDAEQEKQLSVILDKTEGWKKLIDYFNYKYLLKTFQQSSSSPSLLLLNYIAIQSSTSLLELQYILREIKEEEAAIFMQQVLS